MALRDSDYSRVCRIVERGNNTSDSDSRARGEDQFIVCRTADRGNDKERICDLEASSMWEETEPEETVGDDLSGDEEHPTNIDTIYDYPPVYDEYRDDEWYYWAIGISMVKDEILDSACSNSKHVINFVCSNETVGGLLLPHPFPYDFDQRDMFYFYIFPTANNVKKDFKKEVVFFVDISGSMQDDPLEKTLCAITSSLTKLNQGDSFNIIAFNNGVRSFSSSLELVTEETITNATEWMWNNLVAEGVMRGIYHVFDPGGWFLKLSKLEDEFFRRGGE